ncbi:MAG: cation:proton antiporter [Deltaproteobacteria bacterium]|nr:cation:proton antiporter [Deltaproteobacteria bacterium]
MHLPKLILDLALILAISGAASLVFRWLKQPVVLGYLLAGVLIGPQITIFPTVIEIENVQVWAELGVIFLLFLLGLEFSFKKLFEVGRPAVIAASVEVVFMTLIGYAVGKLLGWNSIDSLFLGGILAISSTTIIIKTFDELGVKTQSFAALVFGILIIEDLFAVLLLALLSTVSATKTLEGLPLLKQIGLLATFLVITVPLGIWATPKFFKFIRGVLNDEARVIISLGLCLALVAACTMIGFSPALGAFLMGAFMAEMSEGERVERLLKPIRDLFGAIFFTSVGMLVDINAVLSNLPLVIFISLVTIVGKVLLTTGGAMLAGQDRKTSFQAGFSMGQIGEFSFIIATLGLTLNVIRAELYPLAVSVALVTTFATPYLISFVTTSRWFTNRESKKQDNTKPKLWDGHLVEFEIHPNFFYAGHSLEELKLREKFGISLVELIRGERHLLAPSRDDRLMPFDRIVVLGTDDQLAEIEKFLKSERHDLEKFDESKYSLEKISLKNHRSLIGRTLRESGIREKVQGIVIGIERQKEKILNPDSTLELLDGDWLWVYGRKDKLKIWDRDLND